MDGVLVIRKEKGYTSHDVVARLRGILKQKKIGHTGTLDPDAEGVLPVCLGRATRAVGLLTDRDKTYRAVLRLGMTTDTQDISGRVLQTQPVLLTEEEVCAAAEGFLGAQQQIPPMYSALKVNGQKLCDLARQGIEVERAPRPVYFHEIRILSMKLPEVELEITCSKGTYIRTLCHDIGEKLGCGGCMAQLTRTRAGRFSLEDALTLEEVRNLLYEERLEEKILDIETIFEDNPRILCSFAADRLLHNGNPLPQDCVRETHKDGDVRMCDSSGAFVGIYRWEEEKHMYFLKKMFY
ncbi:MAG: tRNA pseudouridine(55) synthase TruB [Eubacteriales bacterium]|nr:tRNA pseudouridine(55) synthase TruB [Eubacteriales bacterium]